MQHNAAFHMIWVFTVCNYFIVEVLGFGSQIQRVKSDLLHKVCNLE